jgi:hypothetical protein
VHSNVLIKNLQRQLSEARDSLEIEQQKTIELGRRNSLLKQKLMRVYNLRCETGKDQATPRDTKIIELSDLFDKIWYTKKYLKGDIMQNPILHYLRFGAKEGNNPSVRFNTVYYIIQNPVVIEKRLNPLIHYEQVGKSRGFLAIEPVVF